jgi:hypothetical protein
MADAEIHVHLLENKTELDCTDIESFNVNIQFLDEIIEKLDFDIETFDNFIDALNVEIELFDVFVERVDVGADGFVGWKLRRQVWPLKFSCYFLLDSLALPK